jgi:transcriptional regulator with XRE-family HTH domain
MLAPEQCRAARAWLQWSQIDLAQKAEVSLSTIRDFEISKRVPIKHNLAAIRMALEHGGIQFAFADDGRPTGLAIASKN